MKTSVEMKGRGPLKVASQQVIFELKQRVIIALNKLADRDTYQVGVDELEKMVESLTPDTISPFLSCLLDTEKERKSTVRKECIRLMGVLVMFHDTLLLPYLAKMVASVVKRLKDPDSVVRDACVETMGVLASKLSSHGSENDAVFVALVKPLFEALGEQNKQVQSGSALCLARVIDNACDPPSLILQRMLARTVKLLKNPHFMAKPAVVELNRSIILAGGATSRSLLSAAVTSIQEALRNSDWTTRKAASIALAEIASSGASCLGSFKLSSLRSLESCRFDKVKPVRDAVLHALQCWKSLPGSDTPEPSETGSSIKENSYGGDYSDITSTNDSIRRRIPLSVKRTSQKCIDSPQSKADDWHIEIAVPKTLVSSRSICDEESQQSSVTKTVEGMTTDTLSIQDTRCEYEPMDDKQDTSSVSNLVADNFETTFVRNSRGSVEEEGLRKPTGPGKHFPAGFNSEEKLYSSRMQDRKSLDSTVTESSSQNFRGCCSQVASEITCIRKQLLEIENRQSTLIELLQVFSTGTTNGLSVLQSKVSGLEYEVERISHVLLQGGRHSDSAISRHTKQNQNVSSPRFSTCTPRFSVETHSRQPSMLSGKNANIWEEKPYGRSKPVCSSKLGTEVGTNAAAKASNAIGKEMQKASGKGTQVSGQTRKTDPGFCKVSGSGTRQQVPGNKKCLWEIVNSLLCEGDLESAYVEALSSGDELVLIELLDTTGPVLESLCHKTASEILSTLASYILEQRFLGILLPWLEQVVRLSTTHGPDCVVVSAKAKRELLSAIQEAMNMDFSSFSERRSVTQLAMKLRQLWGKNAS